MPTSDWTPPVAEGTQEVRFKTEDGVLVRAITQNGYDDIMRQTQAEATFHPRQEFLGGYKVGSIPVNDWPLVVARYPELGNNGADASQKAAALVRFSNDPEMKKYLIKRA